MPIASKDVTERRDRREAHLTISVGPKGAHFAERLVIIPSVNAFNAFPIETTGAEVGIVACEIGIE
jgi:hypothetical protein